jgi:hypothetical protein
MTVDAKASDVRRTECRRSESDRDIRGEGRPKALGARLCKRHRRVRDILCNRFHERVKPIEELFR